MMFLQIVNLLALMFFIIGLWLVIFSIGRRHWLKWRRTRLVKLYQATPWDSPKIEKLALKISKMHTKIEKL